MALAPGDTLDQYTILGLLGQGGMGTVYRARDTKVGRDVALKVASTNFSERFEREARIIASLNHPNICTLFDVGPNYLVMELVEGQTLAERIQQSALPLEAALKIARQIATALDYAHERPEPVIHRDLKPANIKIRPDGVVKVLDFGLAKAGVSSLGSETVTMGLSQTGMILGTPGYMSPEQASGMTLDRRTDIWAFGVVLYEMLAGERPFQGNTFSHIVASVLRDDPQWDRVPFEARRLLRACLERDSQKRLKTGGDMDLLLERAPVEPVGQPVLPAANRARTGMVTTAVAAVVTLALGALAFVHFREKPSVVQSVRFQIQAPDKAAFAIAPPIISPDGRRLAFITGATSVETRLWVRSLDTLDARPVPGTDLADMNTFSWSPDSRFIEFVQGAKLKKVDASGGPPQTICDLPTPGYRGGVWGPGGVIVFGTNGNGLWRVSEAGGVATPLTKLGPQEIFHTTPSFLPDGRHFVYFRQTADGTAGISLGDLNAKPEQQSSKRLFASDGIAVYAPPAGSGAGHLLFLREGSLMAQPFDANHLEPSGDAFTVAGGVGNNFQNSWFSASHTGVLVYRTGEQSLGSQQLIWFDRTGKNLGAAGEPGNFSVVSMSPDGTRALVTHGFTRTRSAADIWLHDFVRSTATRLGSNPGRNDWPVWSPDGSRIAFSTERDGESMNLYQKASTGVGAEVLLLKSGEPKYALDWSRDGRFLLYSQGEATSTLRLWMLPLDGEKKPAPYLKSEFIESEGRFSPDTRYVAYNSNASGRAEVYVQPFPDASGGKWMISNNGGAHPRWRRDGKELFYISADLKMMAVDVTLGPAFKVGIPRELFPAPISGGAGILNAGRYDVTPDGQRFLINSSGAESPATSSPITVVLNWQAGLKQ